MEPKDRIDALLGIGSGAEYLSLVVLEPSAKCKCMRHDWGFWWECQVHRRWGGSLLGARAAGMSWQAASQLGLMMNTRGLVALIVLNVGLESGILSGTLFSMMVLMALITTSMATPLMDWTAGNKKLRTVAA